MNATAPVFSQFDGWLMIICFAVVMVFPAMYFSRSFTKTKDQFLVAGRSLGKWESAFSIAATWIWAPALFISAQKAYTHGIAGVFWFTVPNVLCLILFAFFADRIRRLVPGGFSLSGYIRTRYSNRVQVLYIIELSGLALCSFAVQLLAGGKVLSVLTGIGFLPLTVVLAGIALCYSLFSGLKASVFTDYAQLVWILLVLAVCVPWAVINAGGPAVVLKGAGGLSGDFRTLFRGESLNVAVTFGIPVTIGLLAGPFGDQSFWQRAFSTQRHDVKPAFILGALIFVTVPLLMSVLGFTAAGLGLVTDDPSRINLDTVMSLLPLWTVIPFVMMLLSGLSSTLDSNLCSISCIAGHDMADRMAGTRSVGPVGLSRWSMILLAVTAVAVANIKGMEILHLFLFYGTLRASTLLPTIITLLTERVHEGGVFWGILISMAAGLPVFAYGKYTGTTFWIVAGSLITVLCSGTVTLMATYIAGKEEAGPTVAYDES